MEREGARTKRARFWVDLLILVGKVGGTTWFVHKCDTSEIEKYAQIKANSAYYDSGKGSNLSETV